MMRIDLQSKSTEGPRPVATHGDRLRRLLAGVIAGVLIGPIIRLIAAFILGGALIFLTMMWVMGPQKAVDFAKYSKFTTHLSGKVVESWVAVEWNPADMRSGSTNWRGYTKAARCAIVEYEGVWSGSLRRAFCGRRFTFNDEYTLHDIREMSPEEKIPFFWARDASGFITPEVRFEPGRLQWLANHAPADTFGLSKPFPQTTLEALQRDFDRPVELAIAGWSQSQPEIPLALDPKRPAEALPLVAVTALVNEPGHWASWIFVLILAPFALGLWFIGMSLLLDGLPRLAIAFIALLVLVALPWWSGQFLQYLRDLNKGAGEIFTDILGDFNRVSGIAAFDPDDAPLVGGEKLVWRASEASMYADTFGRFRYKMPNPAPASADAALAVLVESTTAQARSLDQTQQVDLFADLKRDKLNDRRGAGLIFMRAAKEAMVDPNSNPILRRAATAFLEAWVTSPYEAPFKRDMAYEERMRLFGELGDLDDYYIASTGRALSGVQSGK